MVERSGWKAIEIIAVVAALRASDPALHSRNWRGSEGKLLASHGIGKGIRSRSG